MKKSLIILALFVSLIIGAYYLGYSSGKSKTTIKYITQEKEVIKYVSDKKSEIYSKPNVSRDDALQLFNQGKL